MNVIRRYVQKILKEQLQSHTQEPSLGDHVVNTNPNCKHFKSSGVVINLNKLPDDAGKTIVYRVDNDGKQFSYGDVLEKTFDQLELTKNITKISESVEFHELDSPLRYSRAGNVRRLALCDTSVQDRHLTPSGKPQRDTYFNDQDDWEYYGRSGRRLKKPRKAGIIPGVSDACVIGFLDYHKEYEKSSGGTSWYIDYMKTRGDKGGEGTASKLVDEFFSSVASDGDTVHFGKMMNPKIGHLKDKMAKQYPDMEVIGARNY